MLYKTLMERAKGPKTLKKTFLARNLTYIKPKKEKKRTKKTIIAQKSRSSNDSDKDKKKMDGWIVSWAPIGPLDAAGPDAAI